MKKNYLTLFCTFYTLMQISFAQSLLTPGDIAIIGIDADSEQFAFVALTEIDANTPIFFTDSGVRADGSFRATEGAVLYTSSTALTKGSVITYTGISGNFSNASNSNVGTRGFNLSSSGDQVIAFTGSTANPNFIFAAQTNSSVFQVDANDSNQSDLPPGLVIGTSAVAVGASAGAESEFDNSVYNLSVTTGSKAELLAAIANNANWNGSNDSVVLPTSNDFNGNVNNTNPPLELLIHEIQGNSNISPFVNRTVTIEGIVTGDFQDAVGSNGDLNGFFIQEEDSQIDDNTNTSEGIFVFDGNTPSVNVQVGDLVKVTGTVSEFFGATQLSNSTSIEVLSSNNVLPIPISINLPLETTTNSDNLDIINLEFAEGMLVNFPNQLTVHEMFNLDRFGEIRLINGNRPFQYTQLNTPSVSGFNNHLQEIASRSIILDDGLSIQNPDPIRFLNEYLNTNDSFRMGDTTKNITGVVAYSRSSGGSGVEAYRIHPTTDPVFTSINQRPNTPEVLEGTLKVASFNVLNFFTTLDEEANRTANGNDPRGADNILEYERQLNKLVNAFISMDADILGLIELENDFSPSSPRNAINALVIAINERIGSNVYNWVNPESQFVGGDAIANGFIYNTSTVSIAPSTSIATLTDSDLVGLGLSNSPAVFEGPRTNRVPLAVSFKEKSSGEVFTAVINHFKSKGSPGNAQGDTDNGNGVGSSNQTRLNAAIAINTWLNTDPTNSNDPDFLILGDLNAYAKEEPITYLENEGYTDLARNSIGNEAYSFVFDGQLGTLDYALANTNLLSQITSAIEWHINADEADAIDYNTDFGRNSNLYNESSAARNSDHDPVIVGLNLNSSTLNINTFTATNNTVKAYPMPLKEVLNIEIPKNKISNVSILSLTTGSVLYTSKVLSKSNALKNIHVPVSFLNKGTYVLKIETPNKNYFKLIVK